MTNERTTARLPAFLRPAHTDTLVRLGRDHDGGYLVDERCVRAADFVLSFGVNDDWSFESDFRERNPVPVVAFDGSVGPKQYLKHLVMSVTRIDKPATFLHWARVLRDYGRFFKDDVRHVRRHVGVADGDRGGDGFACVARIVDEFVPAQARALFVKVDIEGWEYRILDDLVAISDRVCGMAVEFHDVDLHLDRIAAFVERLPLRLCHVHCNNHAPVAAGSRPLVIEATFTGFPVPDTAPERLPHPADMANDARCEDYELVFES